MRCALIEFVNFIDFFASIEKKTRKKKEKNFSFNFVCSTFFYCIQINEKQYLQIDREELFFGRHIILDLRILCVSFCNKKNIIRRETIMIDT